MVELLDLVEVLVLIEVLDLVELLDLIEVLVLTEVLDLVEVLDLIEVLVFVEVLVFIEVLVLVEVVELLINGNSFGNISAFSPAFKDSGSPEMTTNCDRRNVISTNLRSILFSGDGLTGQRIFAFVLFRICCAAILGKGTRTGVFLISYADCRSFGNQQKIHTEV